MPPRSNPRPRNNLLQSLFHFSFCLFRVFVFADLCTGGLGPPVFLSAAF
jgi:hypothetical protein